MVKPKWSKSSKSVIAHIFNRIFCSNIQTDILICSSQIKFWGLHFFKSKQPCFFKSCMPYFEPMKLCKRNNCQNYSNTKITAKQGNAEERPDAGCKPILKVDRKLLISKSPVPNGHNPLLWDLLHTHKNNLSDRIISGKNRLGFCEFSYQSVIILNSVSRTTLTEHWKTKANDP